MVEPQPQHQVARRAQGALLVAVVVHVVLTVALRETSVAALVNTVTVITFASFTAVVALRAAHRSIDGFLRRAWRTYATVALLVAAAHLARFVSSSFTDANRAVNITDGLTFVLAPLWLLAAYTALQPSTGWRAHVRAALDGVILAIVLFLVAWVTYLQPLRAGGSVNAELSAVMRVFGDVLLVCAALSVVLSTRRRSSWVVAVAWIVAPLAFAATDIVAPLVTANAGRMGSPSELGWFIALAALAFAALHPDHEPRGEASSPLSGWLEIIPTFAAGAVLLCMFPSLISSRLFNGATMAMCAGLFGAVLVRQLMAVLEEQRVLRQFRDFMDRRSHQFDVRERQFQALVEHGSDVIVVVDDDGVISFASPSVRHVFGLESESIVGAPIDVIVAEVDRPRVRALFAMTSKSNGSTMTAEWRAVRSDGCERHVEVLLNNLSDEEAIAGTVLNLRDVTDRKELQEQLTHQALHDHLTGLPNRALLQNNIEDALAKWLFQGELFSLLVIDLDDFKSVNDSFGHLAGDIVLQTLAARLRTAQRPGDLLVRLGGNEFAFLIAGLDSNSPEASAFAERVIADVEAIMEVENRQLSMRASLGLACVSEQVTQADDLLRNADLALHVAKASRRGGYVNFEASMHESAIRRAEMVSDLRTAIENDELQLYYQATVDLPTGRMEGVEALLRWPHPERGFVSPADFIPVAEEAGLIVPIGTWVLKHACAQMAQWQARYPQAKPLILNVNLSGRQLAEPDVVETVRAVIESSGIAPGTLVLEMTESVLMDDQPATLAKMEALRELGVDLAIDDFGTGYSSLSYLRQFPISVLKIDRAFVNGLGSEARKDDTALVQAIIDLAGTLQLRTVAEGIETPGQLAALRAMGCDVGQGFLLAKPAPGEDVRRLIAKTVGEDKPVGAATPVNVNA